MASTPNLGAQYSTWSAEPSTPLVGYLSRKVLPIKREDAEPLTREDVQYDLLYHIFSDTKAVFTSQAPGISSKIHFCDLYVNALYHSSKCSKVLKDKMIETPAFAIELAKIALLTNVGRINTTMAFFPEMKTALRTYHPVPSLQKTDGNAQDAPRIKNCLKAALLPSELKSMPASTPEEILEKSRAGQLPPTSVVNLIFVLANHAAPLAPVHFDPPLNFLDLFLPINISSMSRARAFLWLMFHYLEGPNLPNPYDDSYSRANPGKVPWLRRLTEAEMKQENVDTPEEIEWGKMKVNQRRAFMRKFVDSLEQEKRTKNMPQGSQKVVPEAPTLRLRPQKAEQESPREKDFLHYMPPQQQTSRPSPPARASDGMTHPYAGPSTSISSGQERTMVEHAWHVVTSTDPLLDSDEELADEHVRLDYTRRINVIARLRGRPPTPLSEPMNPSASTQSESQEDAEHHFTRRWSAMESQEQ